jgi:16S rRNA U1498 N3-methylase RsmE
MFKVRFLDKFNVNIELENQIKKCVFKNIPTTKNKKKNNIYIFKVFIKTERYTFIVRFIWTLNLKL